MLRRYDEFIVKAPADMQRAFIKVMLGDGSRRYDKFCNSDLKIIKTVSVLLRMHGIRHSICGPYPSHGMGKKPMYEVYIKSRSREVPQAVDLIGVHTLNSPRLGRGPGRSKIIGVDIEPSSLNTSKFKLKLSKFNPLPGRRVV